ncbi:MAG: Ku protein [Methanotrichaceae archaeon]|nr:Ku protein [Methanotrichaceae archaeon]
MAELKSVTKSNDKSEPVSLESIAPARAIWSGSLSIGLVNIPVKAVPMTKDRHISFRMLHERCKTPIHYKKYCEENEEVQQDEIVYGYQLEKGKYLALDKKEIEALKPESSAVIELDRFVEFFQADPHYFDKSYLLIPDGSENAYALLRQIMQKTGKAAIGRMTISSKEHIVLIHYYLNAVVATIMRYSDEILDASQRPELINLPKPAEKELVIAKEIVDKLSGDLDLSIYHDRYKERVEEMVKTKLKGKIIHIEKKKARPASKDLMEALRQTAESLK